MDYFTQLFDFADQPSHSTFDCLWNRRSWRTSNYGGKISFYEDSLEPSENLPEVGSSTEQESEVVVKPVGKLPSTGELIRNLSFVGIGLLVLFLLLLLVRKRVKEEK